MEYRQQRTLTSRSNAMRGIIASLCMPMMHWPFSTRVMRLDTQAVSLPPSRRRKSLDGTNILYKVDDNHAAVDPWHGCLARALLTEGLLLEGTDRASRMS